MYQVSVPRHLHAIAGNELVAVSQSKAVRMRAKHVEKNGCVVYTVWNRRSEKALNEIVAKYTSALKELAGTYGMEIA